MQAAEWGKHLIWGIIVIDISLLLQLIENEGISWCL
jgi:hypothetical protein